MYAWHRVHRGASPHPHASTSENVSINMQWGAFPHPERVSTPIVFQPTCVCNRNDIVCAWAITPPMAIPSLVVVLRQPMSLLSMHTSRPTPVVVGTASIKNVEIETTMPSRREAAMQNCFSSSCRTCSWPSRRQKELRVSLRAHRARAEIALREI